MPQLDPQSYSSQIFWLVICFCALLWVMKRWVLPQIGNILEERQRVIETHLEKAEKLREEARLVMEDHTTALEEAREKATVMINQTTTAQAEAAARRTAALDETISTTLREAEARIAMTTQKAVKDLESTVVDLVGTIVKKLSSRTPEKQAIERALARSNTPNPGKGPKSGKGNE